MQTIITIVFSGLSILAPLLFIRLLRITRAQGGEDRTAYHRKLAAGVAVWTLFVWIAGASGAFAYQPGDSIPRFLIPLFVPVLIGLGLLLSPQFRTSIDRISLSQLVGFQFWRVFGLVFLGVVAAGMGPQVMTNSAYGDLITGLLSIAAYFALRSASGMGVPLVWAALLAGTADLLGVLYVLLRYYPIWNTELPGSELAGAFPMVLLIGVAAPIALLFHVFTLRKLIGS